MRIGREGRWNKVLALMTIAVIFFVMVFSVWYLVNHANHECSGQNCPVCEQMQQCAQNVKQLGTADVVVVVVIALIHMDFLGSELFKEPMIENSLISLKVRMDN
ncbi:hypothetical protein [Eubacterium oxidoreducens]|uniref:Uncharacterized protein n=1 Tax=Eubacterium oxidoreducens TaxID=1732 RepID=A0A1G6AXM3_EUBOX|nr:hypothetical protein [Eubacterium oxidoreducens]SDB12983.1 hypothetical protein SAMN02910417_00992 [Eubacterium oxidoreducens]